MGGYGGGKMKRVNKVRLVLEVIRFEKSWELAEPQFESYQDLFWFWRLDHKMQGSNPTLLWLNLLHLNFKCISNEGRKLWDHLNFLGVDFGYTFIMKGSVFL